MEDSGLGDLRGFQRVAWGELASAGQELGPLYEARVNAIQGAAFGVAALVHLEFEQVRDLCKILKIWECDDAKFLSMAAEQHEPT